MVCIPVLASRCISSNFVARGTVVFSFCRPSRGPTSIMFTASEDEAVANVRRGMRRERWVASLDSRRHEVLEAIVILELYCKGLAFERLTGIMRRSGCRPLATPQTPYLC